MILTRVKNEVGATAIEYGLIASLISVLAVGGVSAVGVNLSNTYCTISKYLGGSGTCSGATSSSADSSSAGGNGSNSNGSSTGSVNSTNSYADGATMDEVNDSLKDQLDPTFLPTLYGGNDYAGKSTFQDSYQNEVSTLAEYMENINATDPITNVFGAYDPTTGKPVTDYGSVLTSFQNGGSTLFDDGNGVGGNNLEVTTASGKVYTLHPEAYSGGKVTQTENASK